MFHVKQLQHRFRTSFRFNFSSVSFFYRFQILIITINFDSTANLTAVNVSNSFVFIFRSYSWSNTRPALSNLIRGVNECTCDRLSVCAVSQEKPENKYSGWRPSSRIFATMPQIVSNTSRRSSSTWTTPSYRLGGPT